MATVGFPLLPVSDPMHVDTSAPSEVEVTREIGFLKEYGVDGLSSSLVSVKLLTSELTELVGSV